MRIKPFSFSSIVTSMECRLSSRWTSFNMPKIIWIDCSMHVTFKRSCSLKKITGNKISQGWLTVWLVSCWVINTTFKPWGDHGCQLNDRLAERVRRILQILETNPTTARNAGLKRFSANKKFYLTRHENPQYGEKPFRHRECGKNFSQKLHLKVHVIRIHTVEIKTLQLQEVEEIFL